MIYDVRWKQRFENFDRAVVLLREPIELGIDTLSNLEKEGMVQRFELALELAWKTLKDYLEYEGLEIKPVTPRTVIKAAFTARILKDGKIWIDMLDHRILLSHNYDLVTFENAVLAISKHYLPAIEDLHEWLIIKMQE